MATSTLFIIMAIISVILVLITTIASIISASYIFGSTNYNSSIHELLTISAVLGGIVLFVLFVILIVGAFTGVYKTIDIPASIKAKKKVSIAELKAAKGNAKMRGQCLQ